MRNKRPPDTAAWERLKVESLLKLINDGGTDPDTWRAAAGEFVLLDPDGDPLVKVEPNTVEQLAELRAYVEEVLAAALDTPKGLARRMAVREQIAQTLNPRLSTARFAAVVHMPAWGPTIDQVAAADAPAFALQSLALLVDPARPYWSALRRCPFDALLNSKGQVATPECRRWFLALSMRGKGGAIPKFCDRRAEHDKALRNVASVERVRLWRKKNSTAAGSVTRQPKEK